MLCPWTRTWSLFLFSVYTGCPDPFSGPPFFLNSSNPTCFLTPLDPLCFLIIFCRPPPPTRLHPWFPGLHLHVGPLLSASWLLSEAISLGSSKGPLGSLITVPLTEAHLFPKPKDQILSGSGDKPVRLQILFPERPHYSVSGNSGCLQCPALTWLSHTR